MTTPTDVSDDVGEAVADPGTGSTYRRRLGWTSAVAAVWLVADQLTKHWAVNALTERDIDVIGSLRFNLGFNRGMAFSQGEGLGPVIGILAMLIVVALLIGLKNTGSRAAVFATGMVLGGAVGNIADRLFRRGGDGPLTGAVVDFIDLQWWPIFNIADIGIVVGAIGLLLTVWRADRTPGSARNAAQDASGE